MHTVLQVIDKFQLDYSARVRKIEMKALSKDLSIFYMPITRNACNPRGFAHGFELVAVANYAGFYLAIMNSKHFTPFCGIKKLVFLNPTAFGKDKEVYAYARLLNMKEDLIEVDVEITNNIEMKAKGILQYKIISGLWET